MLNNLGESGQEKVREGLIEGGLRAVTFGDFNVFISLCCFSLYHGCHNMPEESRDVWAHIAGPRKLHLQIKFCLFIRKQG